MKYNSVHILISHLQLVLLPSCHCGNCNYSFDGGKCLGTFWIRVCACGSAVARESNSASHPFEMMLNFEKSLAMQKARSKATAKKQGNQT